MFASVSLPTPEAALSMTSSGVPSLKLAATYLLKYALDHSMTAVVVQLVMSVLLFQSPSVAVLSLSTGATYPTMTREAHSVVSVVVNAPIAAASESVLVTPAGKAAEPVAILLEASKRSRVAFCSCDVERMAGFRCCAREGRRVLSEGKKTAVFRC